MMVCADVRENISAYADGELSADERKSFEEHISSCPECRKELDDMVRIIKLCRSMPLYDLPEGFRDELHAKLTAAADRNRNSSGAEKSRMVRTARTFASIAAGILLIFLGGIIVRSGLISGRLGAKADVPAEMTAAAGAAESPAAEAADSSAKITDAGDDQISMRFSESNEAMAEMAEAEAEPTDSGQSLISPRHFEIDRSSADCDRANGLGIATAQMTTPAFRTSEMYVNADDPAAAMETVMTLATDNNGELYADGTALQGKARADHPSQSAFGGGKEGSRAQLKLVLTFTGTDFDNFTAALNDTFGAANVQAGAVVAEDRSEELDMLINKADEYERLIGELQENDDGSSAGEIEKLKKEKEEIEGRIESLRSRSDIIMVDVYINPK